MRIYVFTAPNAWAAVTPDVPGDALSGHEVRPSREEAIERCRSFARSEIAAYERLGMPLQVPPGEEIVDHNGPWWSIGEWMIPIRPAQLGAAVARMDDLADELERAVAAIPRERWDDAPSGDEWSIRLTLDHIASGFTVGTNNLEPYPLDRAEAHLTAFDELISRLRSFLGRSDALMQFGLNQENARVRWTPRKVVRNVRAFQEAASQYVSGPQPRPPFGHEDLADDDLPLTEDDLASLRTGDAPLRAAVSEGRIPFAAAWYRYYRSRLTTWPDDETMRWRATYAEFRQRLVTADEADIARVRLNPGGSIATIRSELRIGIAHVLGHLEQIRALASSAPTAASV